MSNTDCELGVYPCDCEHCIQRKLTHKGKMEAGVYINIKGYKPKRSDDPHENECLTCHMSETAHQVLKAITCEDFK